MLQLFFTLLLMPPQVWQNEVDGFPRTQWLALTDTALVPADPIVLVHGVIGLEAGLITSAAIDGSDLPQPGDRLSIDFGGRHYTVAFDADDKRGTNYVLLLSSRAKRGQMVGEAARFNHAAC